MGAYDNYKIITDNSAADFQNNVAGKVDAGFKQLAVNEEKRRLIKEKQKKENHRRNSNQIIYNENSAKAINDFNKDFKGEDSQVSNSLNADYSSAINEINRLKVIADNPDTPQDEQLRLQEELVVLNNRVYAIKDEQTNYIGASAAAAEKTDDQAGLDTSYAYPEFENEDGSIDTGGAAQAIANQLGGKYVNGKNIITRQDNGWRAQGVYAGEDGKEKSFDVKFTTAEWTKFSIDPTFNLLNSETKAVESISKNIFEGDIMSTSAYENVETETEGKIVTETDYGSITTSEVRLGGDVPTIRTEKRQKLNTSYINKQINAETLSQTNEFKISSSDQQKRALIAVGMDPERLKDITGTLEESANFYKDYNKNLKEDIELGLKNANPQFKKDENENWYFLTKYSDETVEARQKREDKANGLTSAQKKINKEYNNYEKKITESLSKLMPEGGGLIPKKFANITELGNAVKDVFNLGKLKTFKIGVNKVTVSDMTVENGIIKVKLSDRISLDPNATGAAAKKNNLNIKTYDISDFTQLVNFINATTDLGQIRSEEMAKYLGSITTKTN